MQKIHFISQKVFEILEFKKICNLIGLEHFYLEFKTVFWGVFLGFYRKMRFFPKNLAATFFPFIYHKHLSNLIKIFWALFEKKVITD